MQLRKNINGMRLRNVPVGAERRRNLGKIVLNDGTPFPKEVTHEDIDIAFYEWVSGLGMAYCGRKLPVYKLYSNQRINEYQQTWDEHDENGNPVLDFFTVSRENNVKRGNQQGDYYNIPGERIYPIYTVENTQSDGSVVYDCYSMKQPFCIDLIYTVNAISSKMELVNDVNRVIHDRFKSLQAYIAPNGYYMSMKLDDVGDSGENANDERRYYSQNYKITVRAYIIRKEDFTVTHMPSKLMVNIGAGKGLDRRRGRRHRVEEWVNECNAAEDDNRYNGKGVSVVIDFDGCEETVRFIADFNMELAEIEHTNIYDFVIRINEEDMDLGNGFNIYEGDSVEIEVTRDDETASSSLTLHGYDTETVIDSTADEELSIDEEPQEEIIRIKAESDD